MPEPRDEKMWVMKMRRVPTAGCVAGLLFLGIVASADLTRKETRTETRVPVILVPGITGSRLWDPDSERFIWGNGMQLISPKDGGYQLALSLFGGFSRSPRIVALDVIEEMKLWPIRKRVYGPIAELFADHGYTRGDLRRPQSGDELFLFAYDWRNDNVLAAQELVERLEALRQVRGEQRLPVRLICQSNGAHICRYLIKYGKATLAEAEAATDSRYSAAALGIDVERVVLVGSSNGGGTRILREFHRGRTYLPIGGRELLPETLFTMVSLYQDLPVYLDRVFLDEAGRQLDLDLFDAEVWARHGFSIFAPEARDRVRDSGRPDLFGTVARRKEFLQAALDRARSFHRALHKDEVDVSATKYFQIQNTGAETADRAVLVASGANEWTLWFSGDRELRRRPDLTTKATALGDGHATVASQDWLSPRETFAMAAPVRSVSGGHFELILEPETLSALAEFLVE